MMTFKLMTIKEPNKVLYEHIRISKVFREVEDRWPESEIDWTGKDGFIITENDTKIGMIGHEPI